MTEASPIPSPPSILPRRQQVYLVVVGLVALVAVPMFGSVVLILRATEIFVFMVAFAGLHILSGRLGLISIGHGAFVGIGGLGAAHAIADLDLPYLLAPLTGAITAAVVGAVIAFPSLRLPGAYLALLTVAVAMALPIAMRRIDGPLGVRVEGDLVPPGWTGLSRSQDDLWQYLLVVVIGSAVVLLVHRMMEGPFGRALLAVRDEPMAAASFGINVPRTHLLGVTLSSALAGCAGGLLVYATPFVSGSEFPFELSLSMFALMVAFGSTALWTCVPASITLVMLPVFLVNRGWAIWEPIIYGVLLLLMTRISRGQGLASLLMNTRRAPRFGKVSEALSRSAETEAESSGIVVLDAGPNPPSGRGNRR
ncbi:MAG: branched-chain amino acid transport system permease protein [Acidimicrobiales bacterium]|jgi:branched-chain amino acid transport system permease protein